MTYSSGESAPGTREHREYVRRAMMAQSAASCIADLVLHLRKMTPGDGDAGVAVGERHEVILSPESAFALYDAAAESLPRCYSSPRGLLEDGCAMPNAICHRCAADGRHIKSAHCDETDQDVVDED